MRIYTKGIRRMFLLLGVLAICSLMGCSGMMNNFMGTKVLMVQVLNDDNRQESSGIKAFQQALKIGGQVSITPAEVASQYPEYAKHCPSDLEGKFYIQGAVANFICSKGWRFQSTELGGFLVFVKTY